MLYLLLELIVSPHAARICPTQGPEELNTRLQNLLAPCLLESLLLTAFHNYAVRTAARDSRLANVWYGMIKVGGTECAPTQLGVPGSDASMCTGITQGRKLIADVEMPDSNMVVKSWQFCSTAVTRVRCT